MGYEVEKQFDDIYEDTNEFLGEVKFTSNLSLYRVNMESPRSALIRNHSKDLRLKLSETTMKR